MSSTESSDFNMNNPYVKLALASCAMSMIAETAQGGCSSVMVTSQNLGENKVSSCYCNSNDKQSPNPTYGGISDTVMPGITSSYSLSTAVYCQSPTAASCSGTLAKGADRPSGTYTFASTYSSKPRFTCRWDKANSKWASGCDGATCIPK